VQEENGKIVAMENCSEGRGGEGFMKTDGREAAFSINFGKTN